MSKVLYISYNDALGYLGYSQVISYLNGLRAYGYQFTLLSYEREKVTREQRDKLNETGIKWKPLRYHQHPSLLATTFDVFTGILLSVFLILRNRIKIIHARSYVPAFIGMIAAKLTGAKLIFDMRGFLADEYAEGGSWSHRDFKYKLVKYFEKILIKNSDEIISLTNEGKKIIKTNFNSVQDITVIPCCVNVDKFLSVDKGKVEKIRKELGLENKLVMVYSGSLGGWYMAGEMVDFFVEAKKCENNLHFLILTNSDKNIIEKLLSDKRIEKGNYSILKVNPEDMAEYLSVADFSIAFIKPCFSKKASSPIKFGEYLATGLPIVTNSGIGDSDSIISDKVGAIVKSFNEKEYRNAINIIVKLLNDKESMTCNCLETVSKYLTLESGVKAYSAVYESLNKKE